MQVEFEKHTTCESLPSPSRLPIIVAMMILFRTSAEQCSGQCHDQGGEQSRCEHTPVNPTPPCSFRSAVSSATRRARFSVADERCTLAHKPLIHFSNKGHYGKNTRSSRIKIQRTRQIARSAQNRSRGPQRADPSNDCPAPRFRAFRFPLHGPIGCHRSQRPRASFPRSICR